MASDTFGFLTDQNTLFAVVLGAILATIGGFVATAMERYLDKKEKEQNAALFFGEILSSLAIILRFADETKKVGDPYGPITMRMLISARNELDVYDRNREQVFSIRDSDLRARLQTLLIRISMPIDGIIDGTEELKTLREKFKAERDPEERAELETLIATGETRREAGFEFILERAAELKSVIDGLGPIAKHNFDRLDRIANS
ncbi:MAG TPA: hypothetical protein VMF58_11390 [Rhizomicrobium sp.]|nr:hypothetical protein [Rhizomicrobium sp.]